MSFIEIHITKSDILFIKGNQYAIHKLKRSKIDIDNSEIQIILTATGKPTYLIAAFRHLFQADL